MNNQEIILMLKLIDLFTEYQAHLQKNVQLHSLMEHKQMIEDYKKLLLK